MRYTSFGECVMLTDGNLQEIEETDFDYDLAMDLFSVRYKDYCYDAEFGLYYLQQRYYDPFTCRFISPDTILAEGQGTSSYNIFAYCGNNPILYADHTGNVVVDFFVSVLQVISTFATLATVVTTVGNPVAIAGMAIAAWFTIGTCILSALEVTSAFATDGVAETLSDSFSCVELEDVLSIASFAFGAVKISKVAKAISFSADLIAGAMAIAALLPKGVTLRVDDPTYAAKINEVIQDYTLLSTYVCQNFCINLDVDALASSHSAQEMLAKINTGKYNR